MEDESKYTNRLIKEKSPYLRQHCHNPVDWYAWGEEAFSVAKRRDVPIFLSIGYATCHWCHVMERESFNDPAVAEVLNSAFVCIKIDREELPEIDSLYMEFAQAMIVGSAGWPLNLILTPDLQPFFASTYLPKHSSRGLIGLVELTKKIQELWASDDRDRLIVQSEKVTQVLKTHVHMKGDELPHQGAIEETAQLFFKIADPTFGGMRGAPKFPLGYQANLFLRYFLKTQDTRALFLIEKTLDMMHRGGIYDHIGGGFARYSVDDQWNIPHFEKMLYDNALLILAYLEAWKVTSRALYQEVLYETLEYINRDMKSQEGGFYSAEDAESLGVEGLFYTWTRTEIIEVLGDEIGAMVADYFGVDETGNFEGRSVLTAQVPPHEFAVAKGLTEEAWSVIFSKAKEMLYKARCKRVRPFRDDKILTSWNGLMIRAFAESGFYLQEPRYINIAKEAALFIKQALWNGEHLFHRYCKGEAKFRGLLDDYSFLISGLISLYEVTADREILEWVEELASVAESSFKEPEGAFYQSDGQDPYLLIRKCQFSDGAEPSGNAVHAENLIRLYQITRAEKYLKQAEDILKAAKKYIEAYPLGYCYHLMTMLRYYDKKKALAIVELNKEIDAAHEVVDLLAHHAVLHHSNFVVTNIAKLSAKNPLITQSLTKSEEMVFYVCREGVCEKPVIGLEQVTIALKKL